MLFKALFPSSKNRRNARESFRESLLPEGEIKRNIHTDLSKNKNRLLELFGNSADFTTITVRTGQQDGLFCFLTSMTDSKIMAEKMIQPLSGSLAVKWNIRNEKEMEQFCKSIFNVAEYQWVEYEHEAIWYILSGYAVLFTRGMARACALKAENSTYRSISEPSTQTIIRGPKDGFIESVDMNISLLRRRIKNPSLRFEGFTIGIETKTSIFIAYIDGIVNSGILSEVKKRLDDVEANALFDSGTLEEFINDKTWTFFPLLYNSERPDSIAAHLLAGKIAILVDGTPFVITVPVTFNDFFQVSEDYYQPFMMSSFVRIIRYFSFMIALLLPSIYIAIVNYHHELVPTALLVSIMAQREGIPFPAVVEAFIMEITFEILREAGIRMPRAVGQTVSIVGGLVIGQAAVEAGIISNIMVIVVALTAIASFVSPIYSLSVASRLLRFILIILASFIGLYGVMLGLIIIVGHMVSLRSFGVPYLAPFAPFIIEDQDDILFRFPSWKIKKRASYLYSPSPLKQPDAKKPSPPKKGKTEP